MTTELPKDIQYLHQIIEYVENLDLEYKPETEPYKTKSTGYALGVMQLAFGLLKRYANDSHVRFLDLLEKTYYFIQAYKYFIGKLEHPEKQLYFPIKDAIIVFLQSLNDEYQRNGTPKPAFIASGMYLLEDVYTTCIRASIEWEHEITKLNMKHY